MSDALPYVPGLSAPEPTTRRRIKIRFIAVVAVVIVAAVMIGVVLAHHDSAAGAPQLTSTERACQQWSGSYTPSDGSAPTGAFCTAFTSWMGQQLHSGRLAGPMMWSDTTAMRSTCRRWTSTGPAAASGVRPQVCDDMVTWMAQHAGNWDNWMMTGRMMGQGS